MAFLVEQAGGAASNGTMPILDIVPQEYGQLEPIFIGCSEDVEKALEFLNEE
jgi:fructose-1,6-bisphosphatase I